MAVLFLCFASFNSVNAEPEIYAEGLDFQIYCEDEGGVGFQMDKGIFIIEVLNGTWNGTDCSLGLRYRGGNLYFYNVEHCDLTLYHTGDEALGVQYVIGSEDKVKIAIAAETEYNLTIEGDLDSYFHWSFAMTLPHEENFMLYLGILGVILIVIGVCLTVYGFRHYIFFTLENKETIWDKDILPAALCCFIFGLGLTFAWLLQGA